MEECRLEMILVVVFGLLTIFVLNMASVYLCYPKVIVSSIPDYKRIFLKFHSSFHLYVNSLHRVDFTKRIDLQNCPVKA